MHTFAKTKKEQWFVAYTYPKAEKKIQAAIQRLGIKSFLPLHKVKRQWSDRVKFLDLPLFPSYLFVKTIPGKIETLRSMSGVARFLSFENKYATVKDTEIELIRNIVKENKAVSLVSGIFKAGQRAIINKGPFEGYEGVLVEENGRGRFIIALEKMGQALSVNIPITHISKLEHTFAT